jgi:hypothetical protein
LIKEGAIMKPWKQCFLAFGSLVGLLGLSVLALDLANIDANSMGANRWVKQQLATWETNIEVAVSNIEQGVTALLDVTVTDDLIVGDDSTFSGIVHQVGIQLNIATNAYTLTPTASFHLLNSTIGPTTVTLANATSKGQLLTLINIVGTNAVIVDSANVQSAGAYTAGVWDAISFIGGNGTNWVETARSNN